MKFQDKKDFIDEVVKRLLSIDLTSIEKVNLVIDYEYKVNMINDYIDFIKGKSNEVSR